MKHQIVDIDVCFTNATESLYLPSTIVMLSN